jgi:hypothetical protein
MHGCREVDRLPEPFTVFLFRGVPVLTRSQMRRQTRPLSSTNCQHQFGRDPAEPKATLDPTGSHCFPDTTEPSGSQPAARQTHLHSPTLRRPECRTCCHHGPSCAGCVLVIVSGQRVMARPPRFLGPGLAACPCCRPAEWCAASPRRPCATAVPPRMPPQSQEQLLGSVPSGCSTRPAPSQHGRACGDVAWASETPPAAVRVWRPSGGQVRLTTDMASAPPSKRVVVRTD